MEKIDVTIKRVGGSPITLSFTEGESDAARERFEFLTFILRPFAEPDKKPVEKPKAGRPADAQPDPRATAPSSGGGPK